jgi:hypothetical protein
MYVCVYTYIHDLNKGWRGLGADTHTYIHAFNIHTPQVRNHTTQLFSKALERHSRTKPQTLNPKPGAQPHNAARQHSFRKTQADAEDQPGSKERGQRAQPAGKF